MKPTKMRNTQMYHATSVVKSKQVSSVLSADLRNKYDTKSIRVVQGDTVKIVRGEYKGIDGKVSGVATDTGRVAIEGIKKEKKQGDKFDVYIHASNLVVTDINGEDSRRMKKLHGGKIPHASDTQGAGGQTDGDADAVKRPTDEYISDEIREPDTDKLDNVKSKIRVNIEDSEEESGVQESEDTRKDTDESETKGDRTW